MNKQEAVMLGYYAVLTAAILTSIQLFRRSDINLLEDRLARLEARLDMMVLGQQYTPPSTNVTSRSDLNISNLLRDSSNIFAEANAKLEAGRQEMMDWNDLHWGTTNAYLLTKEGFKFTTRDIVYDRKYPNLPPIRMFMDMWGKEYEYEVLVNGERVTESVTVSYYNQANVPTAMVKIEDPYHSGKPASIFIHDLVNNTSLTIKRDKKGGVTYDKHMIQNDECASQLFDIFDREYAWFVVAADIKGRLEGYKPKLEVRDVDPSNVVNGVPQVKSTITVAPYGTNSNHVWEESNVRPIKEPVESINPIKIR